MNPSDGGLIVDRSHNNGSKKRPRPEPDAAATLSEPPIATAVIEEQCCSCEQAVVSSVSPGGSAEALVAKPPPPLKSTRYSHLRTKYTADLSYMLVEFQKLERQLLGAGAQSTAGSIERREKLRSFIQHLEETIQQIADQCRTEAQGNLTKQETTNHTSCLGGELTADKQHEENVQKLEEHILGSLLPVKDRLRKQLAAQQGAKHNPVGIGGTVTAAPVKPTFLKKVDGSTLTQKLHGATTTETTKPQPTTEPTTAPKVLYAGLALGSTQVKSSMHAAGSAHNIIVQHPTLLELQSELHDMDALTADSEDTLTKLEQHFPLDGLDDDDDDDPHPLGCSEEAALSATAQAAISSYERQRRKWKRKKRRKKQRSATVKAPVSKKQRGPRKVEYTCAVCNENYNSTCEGNPWWVLSQHECLKCHKEQIPKVDIGAPANAIEYHPALLAHADDAVAPPVEDVKQLESCSENSMTGSDDDDGEDDDESMFSTDDDDSSEDLATMTPGDRAENEKFGLEYEGPKLNDKDTRRLLTLMLHASTCPGRHESTEAEEVCRSAKWLMLHIRDCPGTTLTDDVCPFPWCRKVKHLLYHLLSCTVPQECAVCCGSDMDYNMSRLRHLNAFRMKSARGKLVEKFNENESRRNGGKKQATPPAPRPAPMAAHSDQPKEISSSTSHPKEEPSKKPKSNENKAPALPSSVVCIQRTEGTSATASQPANTGSKVDPSTGPSSASDENMIEQQPQPVIGVEQVPAKSKQETSPESFQRTIVVSVTSASGQPDEQPSESLVVR